MLGSIGFTEMAIILGVAVLIFGPRQLPKIGRSIGEGISEFRNVGKAITDTVDEANEAADEIAADLGCTGEVKWEERGA